MDAAISIRDLSFTYLKAQQPALQDITVDVEPGLVTAFVGQVGSGKSTLFRIMNGLIPAIFPGKLDGEVMVAGQNVKGKDTAYLAQHINLVFDDPVLQIVSLTVEEDVAFGPANLNLPRQEVLDRVASALERVGLRGYEKRDPRSMSGGEQQLLALAGILAMRPRIIALDEPVAMLDPLGKGRMLDAVRELKDTFGATILIAESGSDIEEICGFSDRMVLMHEGRILARGTPEEVFAQRELVAQSHLKIPQVTRICYQLDASMFGKGVPVTREATRRLIASLIDERGHRLELDEVDEWARTCRNPTRPEGAVPIVEIKNVQHTFPTDPPVHALKGITLDILPGDFVVLLGQNGSGKTTLSFHLVGVEKPTNADATIVVDGVNVVRGPLSETVRHINYLFQNPANQLFCQSFGEEVMFGPKALGASPEEAERRGREALRQVGLEDQWDYFALSMDKSKEALLSVATLLAMDPAVLIADEPTGGLDYASGEKVMKVLQELNEQGRTIIAITHDMELAVKYAKRIVILRYGELWMDGSPREIFCQPEKLAETRLSPPQVTLLGQDLMSYGYPNNIMSVEEFMELTEKALSGTGREA